MPEVVCVMLLCSAWPTFVLFNLGLNREWNCTAGIELRLAQLASQLKQPFCCALLGPISDYTTWPSTSQTVLVQAVVAAANVSGAGGSQGPQGKCSIHCTFGYCCFRLLSNSLLGPQVRCYRCDCWSLLHAPSPLDLRELYFNWLCNKSNSAANVMARDSGSGRDVALLRHYPPPHYGRGHEARHPSLSCLSLNLRGLGLQRWCLPPAVAQPARRSSSSSSLPPVGLPVCISTAELPPNVTVVTTLEH